MGSFDAMPGEVLVFLCSFLSPKDIKALALTNKHVLGVCMTLKDVSFSSKLVQRYGAPVNCKVREPFDVTGHEHVIRKLSLSTHLWTANWSQLTHLTISAGGQSGYSCSALANLQNLTHLEFGNAFNQCVCFLGDLRNLRHLGFGWQFNQPVGWLCRATRLCCLQFGFRFNQDISFVSRLLELETLILGEQFRLPLDFLTGHPALTRVVLRDWFTNKPRPAALDGFGLKTERRQTHVYTRVKPQGDKLLTF